MPMNNTSIMILSSIFSTRFRWCSLSNGLSVDKSSRPWWDRNVNRRFFFFFFDIPVSSIEHVSSFDDEKIWDSTSHYFQVNTAITIFWISTDNPVPSIHHTSIMSWIWTLFQGSCVTDETDCISSLWWLSCCSQDAFREGHREWLCVHAAIPSSHWRSSSRHPRFKKDRQYHHIKIRRHPNSVSKSL